MREPKMILIKYIQASYSKHNVVSNHHSTDTTVYRLAK